MSTSIRRASLSVVEQLLANPQDYAFSQAVRLLERAAMLAQDELPKGEIATSLPVARFSPPAREVIRFHGQHNLTFPSTEIADIRVEKHNGRRQWQILLNFIGLTGAMGVMPFHYTEMVLQRLKVKDPSLSSFLDLFNHRTSSLFFQASNKYRLPIEYERSQLYKKNNLGHCKHTLALLSMLGLGNQNLTNRQAMPDESLIFYSGLLTQQVKTSTGLQQIIQSYFSVPAKVDSFVGQWQELIDDVRTRLPNRQLRRGQNTCLGRSCMLGRRGWFAQGKCRIKLGPLNKEQMDKFAPGTGALKALNHLTSIYLGMEQNFEFVILVNREDIPKRVALKQDKPPQLRWNTWLSGTPKTNTEKDEILEIAVSSERLK